MKDQDKHKWHKINLSDEDKRNRIFFLKERHKCIRGDCNCIRDTLLYFENKQPRHIFHYERGMRDFGENLPECFGDIPINDQGID